MHSAGRKDPGLLKSFVPKRLRELIQRLEKLAPDPKSFTYFRTGKLVKIYPTSPKKSDFYQQTLNPLSIFLPQRWHQEHGNREFIFSLKVS
jgi:hypothetical protein